MSTRPTTAPSGWRRSSASDVSGGDFTAKDFRGTAAVPGGVFLPVRAGLAPRGRLRGTLPRSSWACGPAADGGRATPPRTLADSGPRERTGAQCLDRWPKLADRIRRSFGSGTCLEIIQARRRAVPNLPAVPCGGEPLVRDVGFVSLPPGRQNRKADAAAQDRRWNGAGSDHPLGQSVGLAGFEPATSATQTRRASQAALQPVPTRV